MKISVKKVIVLTVLILLITQTLFAESFRVKKVLVQEFENETSTAHLTLGMGEAVHIVLPENRLFMKGIQMKIVMPAALAEYGGGVAYSFYRNVHPTPSEDIIDYDAESVYIGTFTNRLTYHMDIPLIANESLTNDPYTSTIYLPNDMPIDDIFFRVHIVMKGVPDGLWDSSVDIELKPVVSNEGLLDLSIEYPEQMDEDKEAFPYIVFIDDDLVEHSHELILLDAGSHHITVSSEFFRTEVQTFSIEKTQTTQLNIELQDIAPLLAVSAPENTQFFLNDIEYEDFSQPIKIDTGTHQLRFSIGEYEIIRTLEVLNGRTYNVDVSFDVAITEE